MIFFKENNSRALFGKTLPRSTHGQGTASQYSFEVYNLGHGDCFLSIQGDVFNFELYRTLDWFHLQPQLDAHSLVFNDFSQVLKL